MSDLAIAQVGFIASALAMAVALTAFTWRMRPRVLRLRDDPPPNAHYIELDPDTAEDDDESKARKAEIAKQKEAEVFYHALHFCEGRCSYREIKETIDAQWNSYYEDWAEYKKYWHISEKFIRDTLSKYDYSKSGDVIKLSGEYSGAFVLIEETINGSKSRVLVDVKKMVYVYFNKETVKEVEAVPESAVVAPEPAVERDIDPAPMRQSIPIMPVNAASLPMAAD